DPALAHSGTELARRQNTLAIALLNSRRPGSAEISIRITDPPGLQFPDFWSIAIERGMPVAADAPPLLHAVLELATGVAPPTPLRYDEALVEWWSEHGMRHALPLDAQWRTSRALGLVDDVGV